MIPVTDRIRQSMVSLHMARALETLDQTLSRLEKGEISAIEAIDQLLAEESPGVFCLGRPGHFKRDTIHHTVRQFGASHLG